MLLSQRNAHRGRERRKCSKSRLRAGCLLWRLGRLFSHRLHSEMDSPLQQQHLQEYNLQLHRLAVLVHKQILPGQTHREPAPLNTFEKSAPTEPISPTSSTRIDKLQNTPHPETSTAAPPRPYRKTDRNTTDGKDNTSKPVIRRLPAFVQNPVVTQNKYSSLQEEGIYDNG